MNSLSAGGAAEPPFVDRKATMVVVVRNAVKRLVVCLLLGIAFFAIHNTPVFGKGPSSVQSFLSDMPRSDDIDSKRGPVCYPSSTNTACDQLPLHDACFAEHREHSLATGASRGSLDGDEDRGTWIGFVGIDGSKQPQDLGVNAHFGGRVAINYGRILFKHSGLGIQLGTAITGTGNAVQVMERLEGTSDRFQSFSTVGFFQRRDSGWSWACGYDFLYQDYFDQSLLGQWRGQFSRQISAHDELGMQVAISSQDDHVRFLNDSFQFEPLSYGRMTWRHYWESNAFTTAWAGFAESHSETNVALGDLPAAGRQFLFGADFRAPLNRCIALYGEANFLMPADTGSVDAFLGVEITTGRCTSKLRSVRSRPLLSLAGNPSFLVDSQRVPAP